MDAAWMGEQMKPFQWKSATEGEIRHRSFKSAALRSAGWGSIWHLCKLEPSSYNLPLQPPPPDPVKPEALWTNVALFKCNCVCPPPHTQTHTPPSAECTWSSNHRTSCFLNAACPVATPVQKIRNSGSLVVPQSKHIDYRYIARLMNRSWINNLQVTRGEVFRWFPFRLLLPLLNATLMHSPRCSV